MLLHLLRHADAGDPETWTGPDAARPLSDKGRKQSKRLGTFLAGIQFSGGPFITSPKVRAAETAQLAADDIDAEVVEDERLASGLDIEIVERILTDAGDPDGAVLVGHDPDFSDLLGELCAAPALEMRKGAFARIEIARPLQAGAGTLRWLIPPDALKPPR